MGGVILHGEVSNGLEFVNPCNDPLSYITEDYRLPLQRYFPPLLTAQSVRFGSCVQNFVKNIQLVGIATS